MHNAQTMNGMLLCESSAVAKIKKATTANVIVALRILFFNFLFFNSIHLVSFEDIVINWFALMWQKTRVLKRVYRILCLQDH